MSSSAFSTTVLKSNDARTRFWAQRSLTRVSGVTEPALFVLERLTAKNLGFWENYNQDQKRNTDRMGMFDGTDAKGNSKNFTMADGTGSFRTSLELFTKLGPGATFETWIAYVLNSSSANEDVAPIADAAPLDDEESVLIDTEELDWFTYKAYSRIEMCFSVFVDGVSPIIGHMGIYRNYLWFRSPRAHRRISHMLHAFSALACQQIHPESPKILLVTRPAVEMRQIIVAEMRSAATKTGAPVDTVITVGDDGDRKRHIDGLAKAKLDCAYLESIKETPEQFDAASLCSLGDYEIDRVKKAGEKSGDLGMVAEALRRVKDSISHYNDQWNASEKGYRFMLPSNVEERSLLNNTDPELWSVADPQATNEEPQKKISFKRPGWYAHADMRNHLTAVAASISTLSSLF
jgi:hypothetical protein